MIAWEIKIVKMLFSWLINERSSQYNFDLEMFLKHAIFFV